MCFVVCRFIECSVFLFLDLCTGALLCVLYYLCRVSVVVAYWLCRRCFYCVAPAVFLVIPLNCSIDVYMLMMILCFPSTALMSCLFLAQHKNPICT